MQFNKKAPKAPTFREWWKANPQLQRGTMLQQLDAHHSHRRAYNAGRRAAKKEGT